MNLQSVNQVKRGSNMRKACGARVDLAQNSVIKMQNLARTITTRSCITKNAVSKINLSIIGGRLGGAKSSRVTEMCSVKYHISNEVKPQRPKITT